jgi:hypothetical protein
MQKQITQSDEDGMSCEVCGRIILSVRDQNKVAPLRKKRLMTLVQLFLIF